MTSLSENVIFEKRPDWGKEPCKELEEEYFKERDRNYKDLEVEINLVCLENSKIFQGPEQHEQGGER